MKNLLTLLVAATALTACGTETSSQIMETCVYEDGKKVCEGPAIDKELADMMPAKVEVTGRANIGGQDVVIFSDGTYTASNNLKTLGENK